jgi:hypothetical protein
MRVTIIVEDAAVYVAGQALKVDVSSIDADIHAVQWYDTFGEVEYKTINGNRKPNLKITDLSPFLHHVDNWNVALTAKKAAEAAAAAAKKTAPSKPAAGAPVSVIAP